MESLIPDAATDGVLAVLKPQKPKAKKKSAAPKPKAKKPTKPKPAKKAAIKKKTKSKAKVKSTGTVVRGERLDMRLSKAEKARVVAKAKKLRRTVTSLVIEAIEKIK